MPKRAEPIPDDLHEWVSFEDPDEHRTWVFDVTFLRSGYRCIYGAGCRGIHEAPLDPGAGDGFGSFEGCCSHGAHFVDADDVANVERHAARLRPDQMQFHAKLHKKGVTVDGDPVENHAGELEPTVLTRTVKGACIFLNREGFAGGVGCALHIGAVEAGERPLDWKPQVCWQVPIRLEHSTDESGHVTSRLREWKRRDWGEGGDDFGWWCTEERDAFVGERPLYVTARDEIIELVGSHIYEMLLPYVDRPDWVPLPHPAFRRT